MKRLQIIALLAVPLPLAAQSLAYEGGLSVTTGRYFFDTRTTSVALSTGLALTAGRITVRVGIPVLTQNTELVTSSGIGGMPSGGPISGMVSDSGRRGGRRGGGGMSVPSFAAPGYAVAVGDPSALLTAHLVDARRASMTAGVGVKFPLTDTTSFGTGQWDAGVSLGLTLHPTLRTLVGLDASYWHLGDLPALDFRDPVFGTISVARMFDGWGASIGVSGGTSALPGYEAPVSVSASFHHFRATTLWGVTATIGLTETVPEFALSAIWRVPF
jgi:hypothetical protein